MTRSSIYKTKQKETLLKFIHKQKHEFTINSIYEGLNKEVGLTTIYRFVDKLIKDGYVTKIIKGSITYYQYLEKCDKENHFYLKCEKCGSLTHVDCDCIDELANHIKKHHEFKLNKEKIIIDGICKKCNRKAI